MGDQGDAELCSFFGGGIEGCAYKLCTKLVGLPMKYSRVCDDDAATRGSEERDGADEVFVFSGDNLLRIPPGALAYCAVDHFQDFGVGEGSGTTGSIEAEGIRCFGRAGPINFEFRLEHEEILTEG